MGFLPFPVITATPFSGVYLLRRGVISDLSGLFSMRRLRWTSVCFFVSVLSLCSASVIDEFNALQDSASPVRVRRPLGETIPLDEYRGRWFITAATVTTACTTLDFDRLAGPNAPKDRLRLQVVQNMFGLLGERSGTIAFSSSIATVNGTSLDFDKVNGELPMCKQWTPLVAMRNRKGELQHIVVVVEYYTVFVLSRKFKKYTARKEEKIVQKLKDELGVAKGSLITERLAAVPQGEQCIYSVPSARKVISEAVCGQYDVVIANLRAFERFGGVTDCAGAQLEPDYTCLLLGNISTNSVITVEGRVDTDNRIFPGQSQFTGHFDGSGTDDFWITKVGPMRKNPDGPGLVYDYVILIPPADRALRVLARKKRRFNRKYKDSVLQYLKKHRFRDDELVFLKAGKKCPTRNFDRCTRRGMM